MNSRVTKTLKIVPNYKVIEKSKRKAKIMRYCQLAIARKKVRIVK